MTYTSLLNGDLADGQWFTDFKNGLPDSLKYVHEKFYPGVLNYIRRLLNWDFDEDAKDIAGESFLKAWNDRQRIKSPEHLRNYLFNVSRNAFVDRIRKPEIISGDKLLENQFGTDGILAIDAERIKTEVIQRLHQAIKEAPHGDILRLRYLEGKSIAEIAEIKQIPKAQVYLRQFRCLEKLRAMLPPDIFYGLILAWILRRW